jgi:nanoRNase/pAp phosphatase (c-di-AMP/oligoRNAs hydrolase)
MKTTRIARMLEDPSVRKIELDHHLQSDSQYAGDPDYSLVSDASSTCELIGYLSLKLSFRPEIPAYCADQEFFSRNLALAILTGIVGDSQMGKYLKTSRERWYYRIFSDIFDKLLTAKTEKNSRNLSSMEDIFDFIQNLSAQETACYSEMKKNIQKSKSIHCIILSEEQSKELFGRYGEEIIVNVSKAAADKLAETSRKLGLVVYYDDTAISDFIQFRMRRSARFQTLDLRTVIAGMGITNGGGHPGAVGFRIRKTDIPEIHGYINEFTQGVEKLLEADE